MGVSKTAGERHERMERRWGVDGGVKVKDEGVGETNEQTSYVTAV